MDVRFHGVLAQLSHAQQGTAYMCCPVSLCRSLFILNGYRNGVRKGLRCFKELLTWFLSHYQTCYLQFTGKTYTMISLSVTGLKKRKRKEMRCGCNWITFQRASSRAWLSKLVNLRGKNPQSQVQTNQNAKDNISSGIRSSKIYKI